MKALFYTATAIFVGLASVVAFFAFQDPGTTAGARVVVIDIDASAMPADETAGQSDRLPEPYANEQDTPADAATEPSDAGALPGGTDTQQPQSTVAGDLSAPVAQNGMTREVITGSQAGPAIAALEGGRPSQDTPADPSAGTLTVPGNNLQIPADPLTPGAGPGSPEDAARLAPADVASLAPAETVPAAPPPPNPMRRPSNIPAPGERVAAAEGAWGGTQFATTEVAPPKPARIAILIRGMGRNGQDSLDAISKLPSAVSLGFLPYAAGVQQLATRAREKGHEVIVQLPLEPTEYPAIDPGPETLLTTLPPEENATRLDSVLNRFEGYSGVTNLMGGKMLQSKASLKPLLEEIKSRGLVYVGDNNNSHANVRQLAREISLRYSAAQVTIDTQATPEAIDKALSRLVAIARQRGSAIGIGTASAATVSQLENWSRTLAEQNITLVPVGALAQTPGAS